MLNVYTIRFAATGQLPDRHSTFVCGDDAEAMHLAVKLCRRATLQVVCCERLVGYASIEGVLPSSRSEAAHGASKSSIASYQAYLDQAENRRRRQASRRTDGVERGAVPSPTRPAQPDRHANKTA